MSSSDSGMVSVNREDLARMVGILEAIAIVLGKSVKDESLIARLRAVLDAPSEPPPDDDDLPPLRVSYCWGDGVWRDSPEPWPAPSEPEGPPTTNRLPVSTDLVGGPPSPTPSLPDDERGPIFTEVPSALHIMHWFLDKQMAKEWVGCGGDADYVLSWDPESETGCHVDLIAHVDHDASWFWLLSVGTQLDGGPTSYDLLCIAADLDGQRSCEWRNEPSAAQPWHYDGLVWFAGQIEERRLAASRPDVAPQPAVVETPPDLADSERSDAPLTIHPPSYLAGWNDAKAGRQYGEGRVDVAPQPEEG